MDGVVLAGLPGDVLAQALQLVTTGALHPPTTTRWLLLSPPPLPTLLPHPLHGHQAQHQQQNKSLGMLVKKNLVTA